MGWVLCVVSAGCYCKYLLIMCELRCSGHVVANVHRCQDERKGWQGHSALCCTVQVLSTRKRKDVEVADIKVQVCLFAFDCLYLDGEMLLQRPLTERRAALLRAVEEKPGELQYALYKV